MVEQVDIEKVPKKRGRKPKNLSIEEKVEEKIPKKRGRKPKKKEEEAEPKIPKKRGRKPKDTNVSKTINNNLDSSSVKDTILHLKINSSSLESNLLLENIYDYDPNIIVPQPFDPSKNDLEIVGDINSPHEFEKNIEEPLVKKEDEEAVKNNVDENDTNELFEQKLSSLNNRYSESTTNCFVSNNSIKKKNISPIMMYYNEYNKRKEWPKVSNIKCFWCCHNFDNIPCALPYTYKDSVYYVYGNFCSPECAAAYNFDSGADDRDMWERYSLLNHLYSQIYDTPDLTIKLAPPRQSLKIFGGKLTIDEFRDCNTDYLKNYKIVLPPMVSIIPSLEEIKKDSLKKSDTYYVPIDKERIKKVNNDLRLKRSKPIQNRNTLENCMRLKYN